ncbi:MAG: response regulator [Candidatus Omnitrophica bacterium]|nr:response regulator [Candidatus Omnitrophota bacterium]
MSKLLIVDDEVDIREFARSFFKKRGIEVFTAENGTLALETIEREKPDLVLLDITMEGLSGLDVLTAIRENNNPVKVIMVTGIEDEEVVKKANGLGVLSYIHKPLVLEELEKIVLKELKG